MVKAIAIPKNCNSLSEELGYIIGVILGDGCLTGNSIKLDTKDKDFALYFKTQLEKWIGRVVSMNYYKGRVNNFYNGIYKCKPFYKVQVGSRPAYNLLKTKLKEIEWIKDTHKRFKFKVIKGLFDSEGYISKDKIGFCNTDEDILILFESLCHSVGIRTFRKKNKVMISGFESRRILFYNVGITIKRKRDILYKTLNRKMIAVKNYNKFTKFKELGYNSVEIARLLNIKKGQVYGWFAENRHPLNIYHK